MCGLVAAVLLVADLGTLASSPPVGAPAPEITRHLDANDTLTVLMSYLGAVTAVLLLPFLASLRAWVQGQGDEAEWRWTLAVLSGAVAVGAVLMGSTLRGAAAVVVRTGGDSVAASALFQAAKVTLSFALVPIATMVLATARTMSPRRTVIRWGIQVAPALAVLCLLSGAAIFVDGDWFGPGEPLVAAVGLLVAMWLVATSVAMLTPAAFGASDGS